ncbi:transcriptional regulator with XRE-family HTH domain [Streptomyces sp. SAI-135]|uniref:helix-turn-helix domain-containing protein n=1 Tax=unclassified Streptomyces TaxID=2593676 RepID=UPI002473B5EA|nr:MULTISPECIES: helix-turn-helix domain-containing protein [unclassified Streptomyces]MDH6522549.1 transcriptional regulator with XRE-family HTH domain [Streptomyces sp. SAI-090]MDH6554173.1 transcriptional regulator with XRE-family HTH domain [Streptomyces sp. SAI-041]MDH6573434.1 transcriptional regulator with XRE-family HTH domain [Streptomyces sp. SAI-117]MDH6613832.1 transcriptional regulator with XRE-family HTH domain [Streptomyces sp. SAI-135]
MRDTCEYCGSALAGGPGKGRPRKYCGDACRQAAHRRRLQEGSSPAAAACPAPAPAGPSVDDRPALRTHPAPRPAPGPSAGEDLCTEIARDIQDGARDLARLLPSLDGEEPLRRIAQLQEQLNGLTAALVGRARYRRVTWATVSSILGISEDTARHRYTERYILRRLARFNRSDTTLTTLAGLYRSTDSPDTPGENENAAEAGDAGGDRGDGPEQQSAPVESTGAAYNRLSPILSMLIRTAQLTNKDVAARIGCSPSFMSRILSGERVPTWTLTRKFAQACGADPAVLRTVWESEKLSEKHREPEPQPDEEPPPAAERLRCAIQTLHLRAGRPAPTDIAVASRWLLPASAVASLLEATVLPHPDVLETFVRILGGDTDHFTQLLDDARNEAGDSAPLLLTIPGALTPPDPAPVGADAVIKTFSKVLTEDQTVEDGRARLLRKHATQRATAAGTPTRPRPRPLTTITELR